MDGKRIRDWLVIGLTVAGWIFLAGSMWIRVNAMERASDQFARKDVLDQQLRNIDVKIDALDKTLNALDRKVDRLLEVRR